MKKKAELILLSFFCSNQIKEIKLSLLPNHSIENKYKRYSREF